MKTLAEVVKEVQQSGLELDEQSFWKLVCMKYAKQAVGNYMNKLIEQPELNNYFSVTVAYGEVLEELK